MKRSACHTLPLPGPGHECREGASGVQGAVRLLDAAEPAGTGRGRRSRSAAPPAASLALPEPQAPAAGGKGRGKAGRAPSPAKRGRRQQPQQEQQQQQRQAQQVQDPEEPQQAQQVQHVLPSSPRAAPAPAPGPRPLLPHPLEPAAGGPGTAPVAAAEDAPAVEEPPAAGAAGKEGVGGQALLGLLGCSDVEAARQKVASMERTQLQVGCMRRGCLRLEQEHSHQPLHAARCSRLVQLRSCSTMLLDAHETSVAAGLLLQ